MNFGYSMRNPRNQMDFWTVFVHVAWGLLAALLMMSMSFCSP